MENDFLSDLDNFESIWNRVCGKENEDDMESGVNAYEHAYEHRQPMDTAFPASVTSRPRETTIVACVPSQTQETRPQATLPTQTDDLEMLRMFIEDENQAAAFYSAIARQCTTKHRQTFLKISADERMHKRNLQLEYFLLTGDSYAPPKICPIIDGLLSALRMAYIDEREAYAGYIKAAEETSNEDLARLYRENAYCEAKHAEVLRCILEHVLGE